MARIDARIGLNAEAELLVEATQQFSSEVTFDAEVGIANTAVRLVRYLTLDFTTGIILGGDDNAPFPGYLAGISEPPILLGMDVAGPPDPIEIEVQHDDLGPTKTRVSALGIALSILNAEIDALEAQVEVLSKPEAPPSIPNYVLLFENNLI